MLVPGHVVFLWRIIHQHFTLAFLKHISTCCWNKPSWPVALFGPNSKVQLEQLVPFCPFNVEVVARHLRCTFRSFGYLSRNKSRQLSPKSLLFHTSARYCNDRAFFRLSRKRLECVWCVFTQARPPGPQTFAPPSRPPCSGSLMLPW